eukprot:1158747-Pelagomonas_calceolata.AAC.3
MMVDLNEGSPGVGVSSGTCMRIQEHRGLRQGGCKRPSLRGLCLLLASIGICKMNKAQSAPQQPQCWYNTFAVLRHTAAQQA